MEAWDEIAQLKREEEQRQRRQLQLRRQLTVPLSPVSSPTHTDGEETEDLNSLHPTCELCALSESPPGVKETGSPLWRRFNSFIDGIVGSPAPPPHPVAHLLHKQLQLAPDNTSTTSTNSTHSNSSTMRTTNHNTTASRRSLSISDYSASYPPRGVAGGEGAFYRSTPNLFLSKSHNTTNNNNNNNNTNTNNDEVKRSRSVTEVPILARSGTGISESDASRRRSDSGTSASMVGGMVVGLLGLTPYTMSPVTDERWLSFAQLLERRNHEVVRMRLRCMVREEPLSERMRGAFWKVISGAEECIKKNTGLYEVLVSKESSYEYKILKDVNRTLPDLPFFREEGGPGQVRLLNILKAYAVLDHDLGYCQSMSYIAAVLLLYLEEAEAFWVLCQLIKSYNLDGYFQKGLPTLRLALFQLDKLIEQQLPKLFFHFKKEGVTPLLYSSEWLSTLFVYNFPLKTAIRLWDVFFVEGTEFLFKIALAILAIHQDQLLTLPFEEILTFLKNKETHHSLDGELLIRTADTMQVVDKEFLDDLEQRFKNPPKTSIFRIETL
eukprot:TRINITY_DN3364_c0_g1_i1.p1 TRINITY_DN3364_c0_g1~~TRINITY_DN3364_c0_g1_i1.p1  ORF type:complete len:551 (-),score=113.85 TRINITY_DN3364_c0_g1_i1:84-1736(-)